MLTGLIIKILPDVALRFGTWARGTFLNPCSFQSLHIHPLMYATPWFMCLFTGLPCWDAVLAIWDGFMLMGAPPPSPR